MKPIQPTKHFKTTISSCIFYITILISDMFLSCQSVLALPIIQPQIKQDFNITSSPNPVGSGARAMGMGSAFIAVADDATAASWNPAGLSQLKKPEISFALSYFGRREDYSSRKHPEAEGMQKSLNRELNYLSIVYPFKLLETNMIISLNYQRLYDFERDINIDYFSRSKDPSSRSITTTKQKIDFSQEGALKAIGLAYAVEITPYLSMGITFNIWPNRIFGTNGWESDNVVDTAIYGKKIIFNRSKNHNRYHDFTGFNMNIGLLWKANSFLTIGAVIKTPFTASLKHEQLRTSYNRFFPFSRPLKIRENVDLEMPLSYGLGIALRFSDTFTMSFDVYRTEWSEFILEDGSGNRTSPITGKTSHKSHIHATHQVRLGTEYLFILEKTVIPVRCGLFYDPEPSVKHSEDFWGFSVGTGISIGNVILDFAYQFRTGDDVEGGGLGIPETHADVTQHLFMISTIYHF